jgi:hypothetical protein
VQALIQADTYLSLLPLALFHSGVLVIWTATIYIEIGTRTLDQQGKINGLSFVYQLTWLEVTVRVVV